jgi:hypothetical protein
LRQITDLRAAAVVPEWNMWPVANLPPRAGTRVMLKKIARVSNLHAKFKI